MFTEPKDNPFDDMQDDDLGPALPAAQTDVKTLVENSFQKVVHADPELFRETCAKCHGSKIYRGLSRFGSECFACKGLGYKEYKTSPEVRARKAATAVANKAKNAQKKIEKGIANLAAFEAQHPQIAAWWTNSKFEFAIEMREKIKLYGHLTPGQMAAVQNCITKFEAAKAARVAANATEIERQAQLPTLNVQHIIDAFERARQNGIKRPKLRLWSGKMSFGFSRAPDGGRNAGAIYVLDKDLYLGKIIDGRFTKSRDCGLEIEAEIIKVCQDPAQAAIAYGKQFGACSVCARELSDPVSIARGIGPICEQRFF